MENITHMNRFFYLQITQFLCSFTAQYRQIGN